MFISRMLIMLRLKKGLIVEQFQGNYLKFSSLQKTPLSNKRAPCLIDAPHDNFSSQFLAWLTKVCALHAVQCKVKKRDRLEMTAQWPCKRILTSRLRFERVIWISGWPRRFKIGGSDILLLLSAVDIFSESILKASISCQCYKNWKPIDARKFGYDVSVCPSTHPTIYTVWLGVLRFCKRREGLVQDTRSLRLSWWKVNQFTYNQPMELFQKKSWSFFCLICDKKLEKIHY